MAMKSGAIETSNFSQIRPEGQRNRNRDESRRPADQRPTDNWNGQAKTGREQRTPKGGKDKGKGKGLEKGAGDRQAPKSDPFKMDKEEWRSTYTGGGSSNLCWFFANAPRGCTRRVCSFEHVLPDDYDGKIFGDLSAAKQSAVVAKSTTAA